MPGQGRPRGPLCLPQNKFIPARWLGRSTQYALIAAITFIGLLIQFSNLCAQQNQINDLLQTESIRYGSAQHKAAGNRPRSLVNLRGAKRQQRKIQPCPPIARRRLFALRRLESDPLADCLRLAEVIKSRESLRLVEGNWQAMTFERDTAGVFQAFAHSPDRHFSDVPHQTFTNLESRPLAVRQSRSDQQFYYYLANSSPWRLRVQLQLSAGVAENALSSVQSLPQFKFDINSYDADTKILTVDLMPYDLIGGWASKLGPIQSYSFEYLDDVASDLRKRVFALQVKLQQAQQTGALRVLSNPKFLSSQANDGLIQGWETGQQSSARFQLINESTQRKSTLLRQAAKRSIEPTAGLESMETYLQIRSSADQVTWIRSQPIAPSETGRLSISVWLRVRADDAGATDIPQVRMAVDGKTFSDDYYRFGVVGREPAGSLAALGTTWKRFAVHFDDLPRSLSDLRIGFDVVGRGVVEISQVELFDRWFDNGDAKRITQLIASADAMLRNPADFDRCRRLLEEPWAVFLNDHFSLKPFPKSAQRSVPMFRTKISNANRDKQASGKSMAGRKLKR